MHLESTLYLKNQFSLRPMCQVNKKGKKVLEFMTSDIKLLTIKLVHTIIWLFFVAVIFYILYTGVTKTVNKYTWIGIGLILVEGLVLLIFRMYCPLTVLARKYSDSEKYNFDIFLPNWLARHNKLIFTTIFLVGLVIVLIRTLLM